MQKCISNNTYLQPIDLATLRVMNEAFVTDLLTDLLHLLPDLRQRFIHFAQLAGLQQTQRRCITANARGDCSNAAGSHLIVFGS